MSGEQGRAALAILAAVDEALAGIGCDATTDCCRFQVTGREPWLTAAEWQLVLAETARRGRRLPKVRQNADGRCPFLDDAGRCLVYAARPLGCRTHFCERATGPVPRPGEFREAARQLAALSADPGRTDDGKPRPITSWLAAAGADKTRARRGPAR